MDMIEKEYKYLCVIPESTAELLTKSRTLKCITQTYFYNDDEIYRLRHVYTPYIKFADQDCDSYYLTRKDGCIYTEDNAIIRNEQEVKLPSKSSYLKILKDYQLDKNYKECSISKHRYSFFNDRIIVDVFMSLSNGDQIGVIEIENAPVYQFNLPKNFRHICAVSKMKEFENFEMAKNGAFPTKLAIELLVSRMTCPICGKINLEVKNGLIRCSSSKCFEVGHSFTILAFAELVDFYNIFT
ncbi:MAG: hypothetical protein BWY47_00934 [Bacteroidetes bacterium ADurb.Bin302]|nr:MAG: hypothetical protein BWY47_00934 [Bacteroidetes bacterium ADurb.Bin302]